LPRAAPALVEEEPIAVVGSADPYPVEVFRSEKLDRRTNHGSEHPVESIRIVLPGELATPSGAENRASVGRGEHLTEIGEGFGSSTGEEGEEGLPEVARPPEDARPVVGRSFGTPKERPLLPGRQNSRLPRPGGEVLVGFQEVPGAARRPIFHGVGEVEAELSTAELENPPAGHRMSLTGEWWHNII
jgi:hypothetical protein